jgi:hypothetical protein
MTNGRLLAAELAALAALTAADLAGFVPVSTTPPLIALGWLSLRLRGLRWRDVGLAWPPHAARTLALGVAAGIALELFSTFVSVPLLARVLGAPPDLSDFDELRGNLRLTLLWLALAWTFSGLEELAYRGYLQHRFDDLAGSSWPARIAALLAVSLFFGFSHTDQGLTGMLQESFAGAALGALYLASGRRLALPIVAHTASNTLAFVLIYLGRYPGA